MAACNHPGTRTDPYQHLTSGRAEHCVTRCILHCILTLCAIAVRTCAQLRARGVRLYSGERGGVHVGVAHAELNGSEYVRRMRRCKAWLSTTGPADLVGTRFFEVWAAPRANE